MDVQADKVKRALALLRDLVRVIPRAKIMLTYDTPWECLVAVQLSAQCTDKKVNEITPALFRKYPRFEDYLSADRKEFEWLIFQSGFYRNKTKNILAAAVYIQNVHGGVVPRTMQEMLLIPGVARKTANVVLGAVYGVVDGIAVDTHVYRLARQWGLSKAATPMGVERDLMALFPRRSWYSLTYRMIEYGRAYSPARKKNHDDKPLRSYYL